MLFFVLARPSELCKCIVVIEEPCRSPQKAMSFAHSPSPVWPQEDGGLSGGLAAAGAGGSAAWESPGAHNGLVVLATHEAFQELPLAGQE